MIVRAPVSEQALEHRCEAWTVADRVCAADRRVVERLDNLVARSFGESLDGGALALVAILVRADVRAA